MKLSAIILTKGEDSTQKAIDSVLFADEVVVILDGSEESSIQSSGSIKIFRHNLASDFSQQRNFGSSQATGDWLLFLDADETVSDKLQKEIQKVLTSSTHKNDAYYLKRRDFFWGHELKFGETMTARVKGFVRLVKKNSGSWEGEVHERFVTKHPVGALHGFIDHRPHPSISEFLNSINYYSTVRAKELKNRNVHFSLVSLILNPFGKFIYTYFLKLGFLDGAAGFVYSFMMSFHSFLTRAKLLNL